MLQKIAADSQSTYLTKTAQFADALASGESVDNIVKYAQIAGIDVEDIQAMHDSVYEEELKKIADEQDGMTPLMKTAQLADAYMEGADENEILKIAAEEGIPVSDINAVATMFYGGDLEKQAEEGDLTKIAEAENAIADVLESGASDLTKIATLAEAYTAGLLDAEATENVAHNYGVDFSSVCEVANAEL